MENAAFETRYKTWAEERWPDEHERRQNDWVLAAIRAHTRWGQGREVTTAEFEEAVNSVTNLQIGGQPPPKAAP